MKKPFIITTLLLLIILTAGLAHSEVNWVNDTDEAHSYVFSVTRNSGFFYSPSGYMNSNDAEVTISKEFDPYSAIAEGTFTEFGDNIRGKVRMHAMAMGPDQDSGGNPVNPTNGLKVQAFAQVIPESLDQSHGISTQQEVTSWSTRRFTLDQPASYELNAELGGDLLFTAFNTSSDYYATNELIAKVTLNARVVTDTGGLASTNVFTSQVTMGAPISKTLRLSPKDDEGRPITYELMVLIDLSSEITNIRWQPLSIWGAINGTFNLGTPDSPIALTATVARYYDLDTSVDGGGGSISPESGRHQENEIVFLTATPNPGYRVAQWFGTDDDNSTANTNLVIMNGKRNVSVSFEEIPPDTCPLSVSVTPEGAGTVTPSPAQDYYTVGTNITLTAKANDGYLFDRWEGTEDGQTGPSITVVMNPGLQISARFAENPEGDTDGVAALLEQGPDAENPAPNYDGNNDGTADHLQSYVVSMPTLDKQHYVTLACDPAFNLRDVKCLPPADDAPSDFEFPYGIFDFKIDGIEQGGSADVTIILHDDTVPVAYYKVGPTPENTSSDWYDFTSDGSTGAAIDGHTITLSFVDGARGDDDLEANALIVDPGGPVVKALSPELISVTPETETPDPQSKSSDHGCFISVTDGNIATESLRHIAAFLRYIGTTF